MKTLDLTLAPGIIAAMPQLDDPNFRRAVVLLLRHTDQGALGLVLNRPSALTLDELCESQGIGCQPGRREPVMIGGPCEPESHLLVLHGEQALHPAGHPDELLIAPGIRLVTAREGLQELAQRDRNRLRCYLGYAGWGPGQLSGELADGTWVPLTASERLVFDEPADEVWASALRSAGIDPITLVPGKDLN